MIRKDFCISMQKSLFFYITPGSSPPLGGSGSTTGGSVTGGFVTGGSVAGGFVTGGSVAGGSV